MLINLSNHPIEKWSSAQSEKANKLFGSVVDLPFPSVDPAADLNQVEAIAKQLSDECVDRIKKSKESISAVHVAGEFTLTFQFVREMESRGVPCVVSTTERLVTDNPDGTKTYTFNFVAFRPYFEAK